MYSYFPLFQGHFCEGPNGEKLPGDVSKQLGMMEVEQLHGRVVPLLVFQMYIYIYIMYMYICTLHIYIYMSPCTVFEQG